MHKSMIFLLQLARHIVISQETVVYIGAYFVYTSCSSVRRLFVNATSVADYILWVVGLLLLVCTYVCYSIKDILWPNEENRSLLLAWPGYVQLKACCIAAILHACAPIMVTVILALLPDVVTMGLRAYILLTFVVVLAVDALSCLLAPVTLSQVLTQAKAIDR